MLCSKQLPCPYRKTSDAHSNTLFLLSVSVSQMPLKEQQGPERGTTDILEQMGSKDIANELTNYDWELFTAMHEVTLQI